MVKAVARRLDNRWTLAIAAIWLVVFFGQIVNSDTGPLGWGISANTEAQAYAPTSHTACPTESRFQVYEEGGMIPVAN